MVISSGLVSIMGKMCGFLKNHIADDSLLCWPLTGMVDVKDRARKHVILMAKKQPGSVQVNLWSIRLKAI